MSKEMREQIDIIKNWKLFLNENTTNHSERYNLLIKRYYQYREKDITIDTKFKKEINNVLFFNISDFLIKYHFKTTQKEYMNNIKEVHDFVDNFVNDNKTSIFAGELFPSKNYPANDCNTFNVKNLHLIKNRLYGDVIFIDTELGKLSYYITKNKLMNANFHIIGEFEGFTKLIGIKGFMIN